MLVCTLPINKIKTILIFMTILRFTRRRPEQGSH